MEQENNSRRPRNLQGLLRFAMEATKAEDAPNAGLLNVGMMDPERRQFLENALKALTIDVVEQLQHAATVIASTSATDKQKVDALDAIINSVDDIDTAIDFCKIGGAFVILPCLSASDPEIRIKSALLIAELAQNNPYCQKELFEADVLPQLMNLLCENETVVAGLPAVSCLVRNYEPCLKAFTKIGGLECLLGCLQQSDKEKLVTRAAFFLHSICVDFPDICDELITLKGIDIIVPLIQPQVEYNVCLETLLSVLCALIDCTGAIDICRSQCSFKETLEEIIKIGADKPECNEIVEYSQTLLKRIYNFQQGAENTDR